MTDTPLDFDAGLSGLTGDDWLDQLEDIAGDLGFFEPLGPDHQAVHVKAGAKLLVTFEDADSICKTAQSEPRSFDFARSQGWSVLSIISKSESWFRHPAIYQFFDQLTDDGFFDGFDQVLFHGVGGAGYASCAYSVASPGATVLAIRPQATLDPQIAGWDTRFMAQRRYGFASRYGYAPDMIDAAQQAFVVYSPVQKADAIHAALFTRKNMTPLKVPGLGGRLEASLDAMQIHDDLIRLAMAGTLNRISFARLLQAAKAFPAYRRSLFKRASETGHPRLAAQVASYVLRHGEDAFFDQKLQELAAQGIRPKPAARASAAE